MKKIYVAFDESTIRNGEINILTCVIFDDESLLKDLDAIIHEAVLNPWHDITKIPHYAKDALSLRNYIMNRIRMLPFKAASVIYKWNQKIKSSKWIYEMFLLDLINPIFLKYNKREEEGVCFHLYFENISDKLSSDANFFTKILAAKYLDAMGSEIIINVNTKNDLSWLSLCPDYVCWALWDFITNNNPNHPNSYGNIILRYIISKISYIKTIDNNVEKFYHMSGWIDEEAFMKNFAGKFAESKNTIRFVIYNLAKKLHWITKYIKTKLH